ncbi:hypothetical protein EDEG_02598 [Edhazardia aedis USNM 41457]|uniref:Sm domain-containing protein n=1 Tax=Edhazardia aedis (strain USNM 41457) TaxID=1003232 RepID=J9D5E3_EDHAE|nr:hypothetical protein EDEG_02598 [Edhazardia aedis USNM 41457]|eukprot:EJW03016.1 hypothetical protein EDEG_02598 [Edhazardia aedis USNM 41457]
MLFYSYFATKIGNKIEIELKNDLVIRGILLSVDTFLNFKLTDIEKIDAKRGWEMGLGDLKTCSIRGSCVKFARIGYEIDDLKRLEEASRYRAGKSFK